MLKQLYKPHFFEHVLNFLFGHYTGVCGGLGVGVSMEAFQIEFESFIDALSHSFRSSKNHILTMPFYLYQMAKSTLKI